MRSITLYGASGVPGSRSALCCAAAATQLGGHQILEGRDGSSTASTSGREPSGAINHSNRPARAGRLQQKQLSLEKSLLQSTRYSRPVKVQDLALWSLWRTDERLESRWPQLESSSDADSSIIANSIHQLAETLPRGHAAGVFADTQPGCSSIATLLAQLKDQASLLAPAAVVQALQCLVRTSRHLRATRANQNQTLPSALMNNAASITSDVSANHDKSSSSSSNNASNICETIQGVGADTDTLTSRVTQAQRDALTATVGVSAPMQQAVQLETSTETNELEERQHATALVQLLTSRLLEISDQLAVGQTCYVVWALGRLAPANGRGPVEPTSPAAMPLLALLHQLMRQAQPELYIATPSELRSLLEGMAALKWHGSDAWVDEVCKVVCSKFGLGQQAGRLYSASISCLTTLRHDPGELWMHCFLAHLRPCLSYLEPPDVVCIINGISTLRLCNLKAASSASTCSTVSSGHSGSHGSFAESGSITISAASPSSDMKCAQAPTPWHKGLPDAEWLEVAGAAIATALPRLHPSGIAGVMRNLAALGFQPSSSWAAAALAAVQPGLATLDMAADASLLYALSTWGHPPDQASLAKHLQHMLPRLHLARVAELSTIAWSLSVLRYVPSRAWLLRWLQVSQSKMRSYSPADVVTCLNAFAHWQVQPTPRYQRSLFAFSLATVRTFTARQIAVMLWALSRLRLVVPRPWLSSMLQHFAALAAAGKPTLIDIVTVSFSVPRVIRGAHKKPLEEDSVKALAAAVATSGPKLNGCTGRQLYFILYGVAKVRAYPGHKWLRAHVEAATAEQRNLDHALKVRLTWCYARLRDAGRAVAERVRAAAAAVRPVPKKRKKSKKAQVVVVAGALDASNEKPRLLQLAPPDLLKGVRRVKKSRPQQLALAQPAVTRSSIACTSAKHKEELLRVIGHPPFGETAN